MCFILRPLQQVRGCHGRCVRDEVWDCQRVLDIEVQSLRSSLALGLLLSRKTELRPLRVYGEQAEATEFPMPGVSSRTLFGKTSQEGRPNQNLR